MSGWLCYKSHEDRHTSCLHQGSLGKLAKRNAFSFALFNPVDLSFPRRLESVTPFSAPCGVSFFSSAPPPPPPPPPPTVGLKTLCGDHLCCALPAKSWHCKGLASWAFQLWKRQNLILIYFKTWLQPCVLHLGPTWSHTNIVAKLYVLLLTMQPTSTPSGKVILWCVIYTSLMCELILQCERSVLWDF